MVVAIANIDIASSETASGVTRSDLSISSETVFSFSVAFHDFRMCGRTASDDVGENPLTNGLACSSISGLIIIDLVDDLAVIIHDES